MGITARVFGDLKALATVEARTVLGAAVADDVIGLVILTVVVRLVTEGSISAFDVGQVIVVALVLPRGRLAHRACGWCRRSFDGSPASAARAGTLMVFGLAFALAFAKLAELAKLAPIVGAFVAGVSLSRSKVADRVAPGAHPGRPPAHPGLLPPDRHRRRRRPVRRAGGARHGAAALLVVAIVGKLVSAVGLIGSPGDRLLVGLGMIPRGEVGLIFATIGLQQAIFGDNVYASLLLVVLVTTLVTPPLLRWRLLRMAAAAGHDDRPSAADGRSSRRRADGSPSSTTPVGSRVDLVAEPDETLHPRGRAGRRAAGRRPHPGPQPLRLAERPAPTRR